MTSLPLELQGQVAVFVAMLCLCSGAVLWESAKRPGKWLGRITIAAGIFQLAAFSEYAVNQYEVVIARVSIPVLEVANSDNGRERIIERIECPDGVIAEREHIAGWRLVTNDRPRFEAHRPLLQRTESAASGSEGIECGECRSNGCIGSLLGLPGCCAGSNRDACSDTTAAAIRVLDF